VPLDLVALDPLVLTRSDNQENLSELKRDVEKYGVIYSLERELFDVHDSLIEPGFTE
jgi:hypothetical protein